MTIIKEVHQQREEILKAFIAKYGCEPQEIEQVEERGVGMIRWYVRRRPAASNQNKEKS